MRRSASLLGLTLCSVLPLAAGCSDDKGRDTADGATNNTSLTGVTTPGLTTVDDPTSASSSATTTAGTGSASASASGTTTTSGGPKFDLGEVPMSDLPVDEGPIIPETCDQASDGKSTVGCRFYAVDMDSHDSVETSQYGIAVANVQLAATANVTIDVKSGGVWSPVAGPQAIGPLQLFTFNLPDRHIDDSGVNPGGSYRVTSDSGPRVAWRRARRTPSTCRRRASRSLARAAALRGRSR